MGQSHSLGHILTEIKKQKQQKPISKEALSPHQGPCLHHRATGIKLTAVLGCYFQPASRFPPSYNSGLWMSPCLFIHSSVFQFHDRAKEAKQFLQMRSWKLARKISVLQRKSPADAHTSNSTRICNRHRYGLTGNKKSQMKVCDWGKKEKIKQNKTHHK